MGPEMGLSNFYFLRYITAPKRNILYLKLGFLATSFLVLVEQSVLKGFHQASQAEFTLVVHNGDTKFNSDFRKQEA